MLAIKMFGAFDFQVNGCVIEGLQGDRAKSILGRLFLSEGKAIQRAVLADELWPESTEKQGRTNLRRELHTLRNRHTIFQECITSGRSSILWSCHEGYEFDVDQYNSTFEQFSETNSESIRLETGEKLLLLHNGVLIPGLYSYWLDQHRDFVKNRWLYVAEDMLSIYKKNKAVQDALRLANEIIILHPHHENAYLQLMELHLQQGNNAMALHTYHQCATVLQQDLGVEPSTEIKQLYARISKKNTHSASNKKLDIDNDKNKDSKRFNASLFAGRQKELQSITSAVHSDCYPDESKIILVTGEAGMGKTRLAGEWIKQNISQIDYCGDSRCYEARDTYSLSPIVGWFQHEKAEQLLLSAKASESSLVRHTLLSNPQYSDSHKSSRTSIEPVSRERLFDALSATLKSTGNATLDNGLKRVFMLDDVQWCDQDTLDFLEHLFLFDGLEKIVIIATARSEALYPGNSIDSFCNRLISRGQLQKVAVDKLGREDSKLLIANTNPKESRTTNRIDDSSMEQMCIRAEGNPLFLIEMVRHQIEKKGQDGEVNSKIDSALPPRIEAVIQQRISHLSADAALVASYAAVMGNQFSVQFLNSLENMEEETLLCSMDELWKKHIIIQTEQGQYLFSHDCIREVCYQIIPAPQKQVLHGQVSRALEKYYENQIDAISASIAYHSEKASEYERAYHWYLCALDYADRSVAHREVLTLCGVTIELLERNCINVDKNWGKLKVLLYKSWAIGTLEGFGSPNLSQICADLETLIVVTNDLELHAKAIDKIGGYHSFSNNPQSALKFSRDQIRNAYVLSNPLYVVHGHRTKTFVEYQLGTFESSYRTAEFGCKMAGAAEQEDTLDSRKPNWSLITLHALGAWSYYTCGMADQARAIFKKCALYESCVGGYTTRGMAYCWVANVHLVFEEMDKVDLIGKQLIAMGQDKSLLKLEIMGNFFRATEAIRSGRCEDGIEYLNFSIRKYEKLAENVLGCEYHLWLSKAYLQMKNPIEALASIEHSFADARLGKMQSFLAAMQLQKAQVLAELGRPISEVLQEFGLSKQTAKSQRADLISLISMRAEYIYRVDNDLSTSSLLNDIKAVTNRMSQHGTSPLIATQQKDLLTI